MAELIPLISENEIKKRISETGLQISKDYNNKSLVLVGILKGSFVFLADLSREISIDHEIDFVSATSYKGTSSTGTVKLTKDIDINIENKDVLLVEDIVDTGNTMSALIDYFHSFKPNSIKICSLIDKHERREVDINVTYSGFYLEKGFIVGYGLDYNERYRNLSAIYDLKL
ncbi:MAG: hypoxanthine phosphoribosyltransferase [Desulfobacteraceae bacterium]|nr:hypoxanthine phosphoribosyltransferase [Desulfobacteraceae bacterium]